MTFRNIFILLAFMACSNLYAQNATKADIDALSQRITKLEADLERVITENVNLVEQLKIKTISSCTDENNVQWDIVKVTPNPSSNNVVLTLRVTNNSGAIRNANPFTGVAIDSNSNMDNNSYKIKIGGSNINMQKVPVGTPINITATIVGVPTTSSYLNSIELIYFGKGLHETVIKFTGVHIPW